jgi:ABC-type sugar transport system substrate-binding protein
MNTKKYLFSIALAALFLTMFVPGAVAAGQKESVVGVSIVQLNNPFWQRYVDYTNQVGQQLKVKLNIVSCEGDVTKQVADVENLIASGVKGLIVSPLTADVGPTVIGRARKAGIPIAITDRWPGIDPTKYDWDGFVGFIGPDDQDTGYKIAKALFAIGKMSIVGISGRRGASVAEGRADGLKQAVQETPGANLLDLQFVGETADQAIPTMENYESAYGDAIQGVWCFNDNTAMAAIKALRDAGKGDQLLSRQIAVGGMDLNPEAVDLIKEGYYFTSFGGHWLQGGFSLIMLYDYMHGKKPAPQYRVVRLKLMQVTKENADKFQAEFVAHPPAIDATKLSRALNPSASAQYFFEISLK